MLDVSGSSFTYAFPSYSMTALDLAAAVPPARQVTDSGYQFETSPNTVGFTFDLDLLVSSIEPGDLLVTRHPEAGRCRSSIPSVGMRR